MIITTIKIICIILAIVLIVLVILQQGKGSDLGSAFGGGSSNSMFGAVTVVGTASVDEQSLLNLSLYPNPASNIINLSIESNCKAVIDYTKIPKHKDWPQGNKWDEYYFFGGEDYELVFSLPRKWADNLLYVDKTVTEIGFFLEGKSSVEFKNCDNENLLKYRSFSHF